MAPAMSVGPCVSRMVHSSHGTSRDIAAPSIMHSLMLLDQLFVVGPGFSPVHAKLMAQIMAGK